MYVYELNKADIFIKDLLEILDLDPNLFLSPYVELYVDGNHGFVRSEKDTDDYYDVDCVNGPRVIVSGWYGTFVPADNGFSYNGVFVRCDVALKNATVDEKDCSFQGCNPDRCVLIAPPKSQ